MQKSVIVLLAAVALLAAYPELPCQGAAAPAVRAALNGPAPETHAIPYQPTWNLLERMTRAERANAVIDLESPDPRYREVERRWNSGSHASALELFRAVGDAPLGISYRVPPETPQGDWGPDVTVANLDSVQQVLLDRHWVNGNLFAFVRYEGDGYPGNISAYRSTNGGTSWTNPFHLVSSTYGYIDCAITCLTGHVYLWYPANSPASTGRLRRLNASTGVTDTFPGNVAYKDIRVLSGDSIISVAICSKADTTPNDRLYPALITGTGRLEAWWMNSPTNFDTIRLKRLPTSGVKKGLDITRNSSGYDVYYLLFSYIDNSNLVRVWGVNKTTDSAYSLVGNMTSNGSYTSLSAWDDTFHVAFDHAASLTQARYQVSYNGGSTWYYLWFGDTAAGFVRSVDISGRRGYGVAAVYWQDPQVPSGFMYQWRRYAGPWSTPVRVQNNTTYSLYPPAVEWVAPDVAGVVFFGSHNVFFDRSDWTGIAERPRPEAGAFGLSALPGRGAVRARFSLPAAGRAELRLFDASGRLVGATKAGFGSGPQSADLAVPSAGVYFVTLDVEGRTETVKTFATH
jgi:hypothetical protein